MNLTKFEDWQTSVGKLNADAGKLIQDRDELYGFIANEVKKSFARMDLYPQKVHVTASAHEIRVEFSSEDEVIIDPIKLTDLHMQFKVSYGYDYKGNWRVILIFYPFKDE